MRRLLILLFAVLFPTQLWAEDVARVSVRASGFPLPISFWDFGEAVSLGFLGMQATYQFKTPVVVDLEGNTLIGLEGIGWDATLRGGYALQIHGLRERGGSVRGFITPLVGYKYARRPPFATSDGYELINETHNVQAGVAYDMHFGSQFAFALRLHAAFDYAFISNEKPDAFNWTYTTVEPLTTAVQLGFSIGVAYAFYE